MEDEYGVLEMHVLMCEDVRHEDKGTSILLGVYGGEVIARNPDLPVAISFWANYRLKPKWRGCIEFRLVDGDEVLANDQTNLSGLAYDVGEINIPRLLVSPVPSRQIQLEYRTDQSDFPEWRIVRRIGLSVLGDND